MTPALNVTAVLACHNRKDTTLRCLDRLFAQRGPFTLSVVVVDDGSTDGTGEAIKAAYPGVTLLRADGLRFWAGAMIMGLGTPEAQAADAQLWINDDTLLADGAIRGLLIAQTAHRQATGAAPIVVGATADPKTGAVTYGGARRASAWHPFRFKRLERDDDRAQPCDTFNGNCVLVPRSAFSRLGPIDPALDGAQGIGDTDYGLRAKRAGIDSIVAAGVVGTCPSNRRPLPWTDRRLPLSGRLRAVFDRRGPGNRFMLTYVRRHGGSWWPLWFLVPVVKALLRALVPGGTATANDRIRVALVEGSVPGYRVPVLEALAETPDLDVVVYHGQPAPGGTDSRTPRCRSVRTTNLFWPKSGGRIAWSCAFPGLLTHRFDVVMVAEHVFNLSHWLMWLARRLFDRPRLVITGHFDISKPWQGAVARWLLPPLRRIFLRGADVLTPYSESGAEACMGMGIDRGRIFVLSNTLDVSAIRAVAQQVDDRQLDMARRELGIGDRPVFLFIGRLYKRKQAPRAAEAVALLAAARTPPPLLLVIGDGEDAALLSKTARDGGPVRLLGPERDPVILAPLFRLSLAVVIPDSLGLGCIHAFAHDRPVVISPGIHHGVEAGNVEHGVNGLIAADNSARGLADALGRLLDDPALFPRLCTGARLTADRLGLDRSVAALAAALRCASGQEGRRGD